MYISLQSAQRPGRPGRRFASGVAARRGCVPPLPPHDGGQDEEAGGEEPSSSGCRNQRGGVRWRIACVGGCIAVLGAGGGVARGGGRGGVVV